MSEINFDDAEDAKQAVFMALGAASVCWEFPEKAGVFKSERAVEIGNALCRKLGLANE